MTALNQDFDLFARNGVPLRAKCAVTIKEQSPEFDATLAGPGANTGAGADAAGPAGRRRVPGPAPRHRLPGAAAAAGRPHRHRAGRGERVRLRQPDGPRPARVEGPAGDHRPAAAARPASRSTSPRHCRSTPGSASAVGRRPRVAGRRRRRVGRAGRSPARRGRTRARCRWRPDPRAGPGRGRERRRRPQPRPRGGLRRRRRGRLARRTGDRRAGCAADAWYATAADRLDAAPGRRRGQPARRPARRRVRLRRAAAAADRGRAHRRRPRSCGCAAARRRRRRPAAGDRRPDGARGWEALPAVARDGRGRAPGAAAGCGCGGAA